jgi:hypothetical protein
LTLNFECFDTSIKDQVLLVCISFLSLWHEYTLNLDNISRQGLFDIGLSEY